MANTPGIILPAFYSSEEELIADLKRRDKEAGFTPLTLGDAVHSSMSVEEFLEHYGKKGMRWGVRKSRSQLKIDRTKTVYKKPPIRLSDAELSSRIKRLELEKKYRDLNSHDKSPGKEYAKSLLENSGRTAVGAVVGGVVTFALQRALKKKFGG